MGRDGGLGRPGPPRWRAASRLVRWAGGTIITSINTIYQNRNRRSALPVEAVREIGRGRAG